MLVRNLFSKVSMDASDFSAGAQKVRKELTDLNKAFADNKARMKAASDEMKAMEKEQRSLDQAVKSGTATEEQKTRYKELGEKIDQARLKMAQLKTVEQDLKSKTAAATAELKKMNSGMSETKSSTDSARSSLQGLGTALKALAVGATGKKLYDWLIGSNAEMEQYVTSFTVMLGSAEKAQAMIKSMTEFAAATPLELTDIVSAGQLLMNYGVAAEDLIPTMQKLGDLAGGNAEKMNRVALAYGQMLAKGKVTGEELRQMTEAGVPLLQTLAETMGKTTAEVQDLSSKGKVGINDLNNAITSLTTGSGKFAGMMEQQSQTMNGMLSTMKDNFDQFGRDIGEGAFKQVKSSLQDVMDMIQKASEDGTLDEVAKDVGDALSGIIKILTGTVKVAYEYRDAIAICAAALVTLKVATTVAGAVERFRKATEAATAAQAAMNAVANANPYVLLASALAAVGTGIFLVYQNTKQAAEEMNKFNDTLDEAEAQANEIRNKGAAEIALLKDKVKEYDSLRGKINLTSSESERLKQVAAELQSTLGDSTEVINKQTGAYNDLSNSIDDYISKLDLQYKIEAGKTEYTAAITQQEELESTWRKALYEYSKRKREFEEARSRNTNTTGNDDFATSSARMWMNEAKKSYDAADEALKRNNATVEKYRDLLKQAAGETKAFADETDQSNGELSREEENLKKLNEAYEAITAATDLYNSAQKEANNTGALSISTLKKITEQYPKMKDAVDKYITGQLNEKQVVNELAKCYKTDADNYYNVLSTKMKNDTSYYNTVLANNATVVNEFKKQYGIDLKNYASYAEARAAIEKKLHQTSIGMIVSTGTVGATIGIAGLANGGSANAANYAAAVGANAALTAKYNSLKSQLKKLDSLFSGTSAAAIKLSSPKLGTVSTSGSSSGVSSSPKTASSVTAEISIYEKANTAYKKLVQDRIDAINAEKDAKKAALDASINAIDKEIEARKRLKEDTSIQKEIDAINAQLKYAQLDDFSRMELEKKKKSLLEEQADMEWERRQADKKESLQSSYDAAVASSNEMIDRLQDAMNYANDLFSSLKNGSQTVSSIVNNNSRNANVSIVNKALTAGQIAKAIRDMLWDGV
mgnify:CR=1 FL=1